MKKRGFTLIELLVVVAVLVTLMSIVFKLSSIGSDADSRNRTIVRMQRLENCLSGYYAAFGSYPPVRQHNSRDIYRKTTMHGGEKSNERNEDIWDWDPEKFEKWCSTGDKKYYQQKEAAAWNQVQRACKAQPVDCRFPYPQGYREVIRVISEALRDKAQSGREEYKAYWEDENRKAKLEAGFDDGGSGDAGTGRFDNWRDFPDWEDVKVFRFGLMSYLVPRYLVMINGAEDFLDFAQWEDNNNLPSDPFTGIMYKNWQEVKNDADSTAANDLARLANIPSQAVCARWMPNLEGICACNHDYSLFGINIKAADEASELSSDNPGIEIFSPGTQNSTKDQYILDGVTVKDGWGSEFYYYSPEPYQTYTLWSAGKNGRTFPSWVSRVQLGAKPSRCIAVWTVDDIAHMSN